MITEEKDVGGGEKGYHFGGEVAWPPNWMIPYAILCAKGVQLPCVVPVDGVRLL